MLALLSQINPTIIAAFVLFAGGWLYAQARSSKIASLSDLAHFLGDQAVEHALMGATGILDGITPQNAADKVDSWFWAELAKHGFQKNDALDLLVKPAIASAVSRVLAGLRERFEAEEAPAQAPVAVVAAAMAKVPQSGRARVGLLAILALVGGALLMFGCAGSQRTTAINAVDTMADATEAALAAYSHQHVESIIHQPGISPVDAKAQIDAWYAKVDKAEVDLKTVRGLIKIARAQNDQPSVTALENQAATIVAEIKALEVP